MRIKLDRRVGAALIILATVLAYKASVDLSQKYKIGVNKTNSLSNWGYVIDRTNHDVQRGSLIEFVVPDNEYYPRGASFVKRVSGVPGDVVERRDNEVFVNGDFVGIAKSHDQKGKPVEAGPLGEIPAGHVFVTGDHKDSLDSRYAVIGFIPANRILGVGEPIL